jgi:hypothetical protein
MILQEKIFTKEECKKIINFSLKYTDNSEMDFSNNPNGKCINNRVTFGSTTGYTIYYIPNVNETKWMFDKIINWFSKKSNIKLNENMLHTGCNLHQYIMGDKFEKHIDLTNGFENRRYILGIQLNDNYDGGNYVCWDDNNNEIVFSKEIGTAIAYHARLPHEIQEITNGSRWSIVMPIYNLEIIDTKNLL